MLNLNQRIILVQTQLLVPTQMVAPEAAQQLQQQQPLEKIPKIPSSAMACCLPPPKSQMLNRRPLLNHNNITSSKITWMPWMRLAVSRTCLGEDHLLFIVFPIPPPSTIFTVIGLKLAPK
jgi:hypothetical protein